MAVHAGATTGVLGRVGPNKPALIARGNRAIRCFTVVRAVVTFRAHEGGAGFQQRRDVGAMWFMAVGAVFGDRLMLPQERAALFSMAGEAGLVDGILLEQLGTGRAMRVVAVGTDHLALQDWVMRYFFAVCALILVAREADFGLGLLVAHRVVLSVNLVTRATGHVVADMLAAGPMGAAAPFVTSEASVTAFPRCVRGVLAEDAIRRSPFAARLRFFHVRGALAVAT